MLWQDLTEWIFPNGFLPADFGVIRERANNSRSGDAQFLDR